MATLYILYDVAKNLPRLGRARSLPPVPHERVPATKCQPVTSDDILLRAANGGRIVDESNSIEIRWLILVTVG